MRAVFFLTILLFGCVSEREGQLEADSAHAANAIKARFASEKAAIAAAEKAARDSADLRAALRNDSIRKAQGVPSDAELLSVIHRLTPDSIELLPARVRATLNERQCLVPQPYWGGSRNAINGAFTAKGTKEWAVVCSVRDTSVILILTASTGAVVDSVGSSGPDVNWIQGIGDGKWGYSQLIMAIPREQISSTDFYGDSVDLPKPIDHDAINVAFLEKASVAYYRAGGVWHEILTSD